MLHYASFDHCDLTSTELDLADFYRNSLVEAFCEGCDWSGYSLPTPNLVGIHLAGANLSGIWIGAARLSNADFSGADLSGATVGGSVDGYYTNFSGADLHGATISAEFREADFSFAIADDATFLSWSLTSSDMTSFSCVGCKLPRQFDDCNMTGADLRNTTTAGNILRIRGGQGSDLDLDGMLTSVLEFRDIALPGATITNISQVGLAAASIAFINANLVGAAVSYVPGDGLGSNETGYCNTVNTQGNLITSLADPCLLAQHLW